jgi:CubicO group peptidase (beta-lactamase class C family)
MKTIQPIRLIVLAFVALSMNLYGGEPPAESSEPKTPMTRGGRELETAVPAQADSSSFQWIMSSPSEQGLHSGKLTELVDLIREGKRYPRVQSLLVVRHGCLVVEEYFNNWDGERLHILQSVTKSFTSALIGIAIGRGEIQGVEEKILDFFPDMEDIAHMDERKASIRVRDLLTMRSGVDYHENGQDSPHHRLNRTPTGWDKFYLDRPMAGDPDKSFNYDSGGVILLSAILKSRTGMHADVYAEEALFKPLGITEKFWVKNQEGHPHTGGGLALRTRDMARFGLLYLNQGKWEGKQVVPEDWIRESFQMHVDFGNPDQDVIGYGYLWWVQRPDPQGDGKRHIYAARGARGQYIFIVPEHDMVVAINADTQSGGQRRGIDEFLYGYILPAVHTHVKDNSDQ